MGDIHNLKDVYDFDGVTRKNTDRYEKLKKRLLEMIDRNEKIVLNDNKSPRPVNLYLDFAPTVKYFKSSKSLKWTWLFINPAMLKNRGIFSEELLSLTDANKNTEFWKKEEGISKVREKELNELLEFLTGKKSKKIDIEDKKQLEETKTIKAKKKSFLDGVL